MSGMTDQLVASLGYKAYETTLRTIGNALATYGPASFQPTIKCPGSLIYVSFTCTFQADGLVPLPCSLSGQVLVDGFATSGAPVVRESVQAANVPGQPLHVSAFIQPSAGNHVITVATQRNTVGGNLYISPAAEGAVLAIIGAST